MEKKEYFNILLKRDIIRYVLLREPRLTSGEVSRRLKCRLAMESLTRRMKDAIAPTLEIYLPIRKIMDKNGNITGKLPDWLTPALADEIVRDFQTRIGQMCATESLIKTLLTQIERLTWLQGVAGMAADLRKFTADMRKLSKDYAGISAHTPEEYGLQEKYEAALHISITEHIFRNNDKDVDDFRGALMDYAYSACETAICRQLAKLYAGIADSPEISRVIARFESMATEAKAARTEASLTDHPAEWDAEYNSLVPIEFFERNIEDIDAAMAFHMALLQAFARHEPELLRAGILSSNGKITLFTNSSTSLPDILIPLIL